MIAWNSPPVLAQCLYAFQSIMWLSIGIFTYDCCHYISFDWSIIRGTRHRKWAHAPYILSKISAWAFLICVLVIVHSGTEINCNGLMRANQVLMAVNMISCSMLLAFRASCVYTGTARKVVTAVLTVFVLGLLAVWLQGTADVVSVWNTHAGNIWQEGLCIVVYIPRRYSAKHIVTIVYDLTVMILTIAGVLRMKASSRIGSILMRQGIQYFAITVLVNSVAAALTLADLNTLISIIGGIPSCVACVMCVTRISVGLAEETKPRTSGVYLMQSSSSLSEKIARLFTKGKDSHHADDRIAASIDASSGNAGELAVESLTYSQSNQPSPQADDENEKFASPDSDVEAQKSSSTTIESSKQS